MLPKDLPRHFYLTSFLVDLYGRKQRKWVVSDNVKLAYLSMPKVASSAINIAMLPTLGLENEQAILADPLSIHTHLPIKPFLSGTEKSYFKFTFVRNPLERLLSFYIQKFAMAEKSKYGFLYRDLLADKLTVDMDFETVVRIICGTRPRKFEEAHFTPQSYLTHYGYRCLVDYIGKYENFEEDFEKIQKKFSLDPTRIVNKSIDYDYRDYYTPETLKMAATYYREDLKLFGYQQAYLDMLDGLRKI